MRTDKEEETGGVRIQRIPAVCIHTPAERPEAPDKAWFILSGTDTKGLLRATVREEKNGVGEYGRCARKRS